ncbi:hypothetical protein [Shivajiella indica]|uniref:Uncharacterized protein n=1 Tax=Shivajiella indica TaxID=872115 RepID=A0ABW5B4C0_9BACT
MIRPILISLFLLILPFSFVSAQTGENLIDTQYQWFGNRLVYSAAGQNLTFKDLTALMDNFPEGKTYMEIARKNKKTGAVLFGLGITGMLVGTYFYLEDNNSAPVIFWPSFAVGLVGGGLLGSSRSNVQKAVNGYNQMLYKSRSGMTKLDLKLSPVASGLVLRF